MQDFKQNFLQTAKVIMFALVCGLGVNVLQASWTAPSAGTVAPANNAAAPLHVGSLGQSKAGGLILNTSGASNGLLVDKGNVGIGTLNPGAKLDVAGNARVSGSLSVAGLGAFSAYGGNSTSFQYLNSPNLMLPSLRAYEICFATGPSGDCRTAWPSGSGGSGLTGSGSLNQLARFYPNGTTLANSQIFDDGSVVSLSRIKITGGSPGNGKVLTSDSTGLTTWNDRMGGCRWIGKSGTTSTVVATCSSSERLMTGGVTCTGSNRSLGSAPYTSTAVGYSTPGATQTEYSIDRFDSWAGECGAGTVYVFALCCAR